MTRRFPRLSVRVALLALISVFLVPTSALAADGLLITPESADFGEVPSGFVHGRQLTVTNASSTGVLLGGIGIEGDAEPFAVGGYECANVLELEPGESCQVKVFFRAPMVAASYEALLVVQGEGVDPAIAPLTASSFLEGHLTSDVVEVEVGPTLIGTSSEPRSVRVRNAGDSSVAISSSGIPGLPSPSPFEVVENDCAGSLDPGQECSITVVFSPIAEWGPGHQGAALFVLYPGNFLLIPLDGEAISAPPEPSPPPLSPAPVPVAEPSIAPADEFGSALRSLTDAVPALVRGGPFRRRALPVFKFPVSGRLTLVIFSRHRGKRVRIGGGRLRVSASVAQRMRFRLNRKGRVMLRRSQRTRIQAIVKFKPDSGTASRHAAEYRVESARQQRKRR